MNRNSKAAPFKNPLCVALDVDDLKTAKSFVEELKDIVGGVKLGPRLIHRYGESLIREISKDLPVFVDCKFFDIPSTMLASVKASFEAGASAVTVHALAGPEVLTELAKLEAQLNSIRPFKIFCVSLLTSMSDKDLPKSLSSMKVTDHVLSLAEEVSRSGLSSLVCSAQELEFLKPKFPNFYFVTPGIRFAVDQSQDQKRVMGPSEAIKAGSSLLVVGRPILEAKSAKEAAIDFLAVTYE